MNAREIREEILRLARLLREVGDRNDMIMAASIFTIHGSTLHTEMAEELFRILQDLNSRNLATVLLRKAELKG